MADDKKESKLRTAARGVADAFSGFDSKDKTIGVLVPIVVGNITGLASGLVTVPQYDQTAEVAAAHAVAALPNSEKFTPVEVNVHMTEALYAENKRRSAAFEKNKNDKLLKVGGSTAAGVAGAGALAIGGLGAVGALRERRKREEEDLANGIINV